MARAVLVLQPFARRAWCARPWRRSGSRASASPPPPRSRRPRAGSRTSSSRCRSAASAWPCARVARGRRDPGGDGARLVDALLEDLAVLRLLVVRELLAVLGLVELAERRVDADLAEEVCHAEGARLVGDDGHDAPAQRRVRSSAPAMRTKATVVDISLPPASSANFANAARRGRRRAARTSSSAPAGSRRASRAARAGRPSRAHSRGGRTNSQFSHLRVGERQREAVAEGDELLGVELLLLMRGHAPLPRRAHAVALLGLGEDHGGLALRGGPRASRPRRSSPGRGRRGAGGRCRRRRGARRARCSSGYLLKKCSRLKRPSVAA